MGLFKESINMGLQYAFLFQLGFKYGNHGGAKGEAGYTKIIYHNDDSETLWITVNPVTKKLYLYNEYECGGMLWEREVDIPDNAFDNENNFIDWLDEQI